MLSKNRLALLVTLMSAAFFILLFFTLPPSVIEPRSNNPFLLVFKIGFLSVTAAITIAILLIIVLKREFIQRQLSSFNRFKHLLRLLVKRDFVARYKRNVLGVLWSLLNPLLTMLIMTMVFSFLFRYQIANFPVYLLSGLIIFGFFNESTNQAMGAIISSADILKKVYVPKYVFPLSRVLSSLVNLGFSFLAFLLVFTITRAPLHWTIVLVPIPIVYTFIFALGIGMLISSLAVFFRDITYLYPILLTLLMYLTPLFYPISILPEQLQPFIGLNPMYHFIDYFRSVALNGVVPDLWANVVCIGFALSALCCGVYVFMSKQDRYILYL